MFENKVASGGFAVVGSRLRDELSAGQVDLRRSL